MVEEFVFRACVLSTLRYAQTPVGDMILYSPLLFGAGKPHSFRLISSACASRMGKAQKWICVVRYRPPNAVSIRIHVAFRVVCVLCVSAYRSLRGGIHCACVLQLYGVSRL
jgi:hypothetical protein